MAAGPRQPGALKRRALLAESSPQLAEAGLAFLEDGRLGEALECLRAVDHQEGLRKLMEVALAGGDIFFWQQAAAFLGLEPTGQDLEQLEQNARQAGKINFAQRAADLAQARSAEASES